MRYAEQVFRESSYRDAHTHPLTALVVSLRTKVDRIQLWTRGKTDVERLNAIAKKMIKLLDVTEADNIGLEFQVPSHIVLLQPSDRSLSR